MEPTLADRNNNPGNLKDPSTGQFRQFKSPQEGYAALLNDLQGKKTATTSTGLGPSSTLVDFSKVYAPASDKNDPAQYTANLANHMGVRPDAQLKDLDVGVWAEAVAKAEGFTPAKAYKPRKAVNTQPEAPQQATNEAGTWFTAKPTDTPVMAGLKAAGNLIPSAWNFGKGILSQVNPINTVSNLAQIPGVIKDISQQNIPVTQKLGNVIGGTYESVIPQSARQLVKGDIAGAQKTVTEDPFGQVAPWVFAAEGGAKLADLAASRAGMAKYVKNISAETAGEIPKPVTKYTDAFGKTVETIAKPVMKTAGLLEPLLKLPMDITKGLASQFWSLDKRTMQTIIDNPGEFSKLKQDAVSRPSLASEFSDAIDNFTEIKKDTGAEYNAIRTMDKPVVVPPDFFKEALAEFKLSLDKKGQVKADTTSLTRNPSDLAAVQRFLDNWSKKKTLTPEEILNMRSDIAGDLSKFQMDKTTAATKIGDKLYARVNDTLGKQVPGLRELDAKMSPMIEQAKQIKKDFLDKDGNFKDGAISKIANATGKGKENLLARMEEIAPGITKRIQVLKAVEDIEAAAGFKVGAYSKMITGTAGFGLGGPLGLIITEIIASPHMAVQILKRYGVAKAQIKTIAQTLKLLAGGSPETVARVAATTQGAEQSQYRGLLNQGKTLTNTPQ